MLEITLHEISKRFVREWILKKLSLKLSSGKSYAITGPNGSGKSTLAQIICAFSTPTKGHITYNLNGDELSTDDVYRICSFTGPYMELIEELTLTEMLTFHYSLKELAQTTKREDLLSIMQLEHAADKEIRYFSSGMKQRLKVGLALMTNSELVIMDEPTTNLDDQGVNWYLEMVQRFASDRILVVCSNQKREYEFCDQFIDLMNWKEA